MPNPSKPHCCVLCNAKLASKEELQDHFRKHANKEIDSKGRPKKITLAQSMRKTQSVNKPLLAANSASSSAAQAGPSVTKKTDEAKPGKSTPDTGSKQAGTSMTQKPSNKKLAQPIACDVCNQEFDTVTLAIQHKFRKHPNSAIKHYCPYCGMQFPLKINRDMHLSTHPEPRPSDPFPCSECGVEFYTAQAQNYHYKSTHKRIVAFFKPVVTPPPSKKIRVNNAGEAQSVFYCHLCGYEYIVKFNLQKHLERQHSEEERDGMPTDLIKCITCDALFYNKKAYENHNMYHKPDDLYVTSEEQRLQTVTRVDQDFDIRRVQTPAEKFIPVYRPRPVMDLNNKSNNKSGKRKRLEDRESSSSDSELSPDSCSMSSSDSDSDAPLQRRVQQRVGKKKSAPSSVKKLKTSTKSIKKSTLS